MRQYIRRLIACLGRMLGAFARWLTSGPPTTTSTMQAPVRQVDFKVASRRHKVDADVLIAQGRGANAGQLYGFAAECGLKALLVAHGLRTGPNGDILDRNRYRSHVPVLSRAVALTTIFPDGRAATRYISMLPNLSHFDDWSVDHRYWTDAALPAASVANWRIAASEVSSMLDAATVDGVMP